MASKNTLAIRAHKRIHKTVSMGPLALVHFWGQLPSTEAVSIRRSEWRRYLNSGKVCAVSPVHIPDTTTKRRAFDVRPEATRDLKDLNNE